MKFGFNHVSIGLYNLRCILSGKILFRRIIMATSVLHECDVKNELEGTTNDANIGLIFKAVYLATDATYTNQGFGALDYLLAHLKNYGIDEDSLCNDLKDQGVDTGGIKTQAVKLDFLRKWLLPEAYGVHKHGYTHKGADYNYDRPEEDDDNWSGKEKQQSWQVRRKLLRDTIKNVYSIPPDDAEKIAITLYSIHRLRDLEFNGGEATPVRDYYLGICDDLRKYALPLTAKNASFHTQIKESIDRLDDEIMKTKNDIKNWPSLKSTIDSLLGTEKDSMNGFGGLYAKIIPYRITGLVSSF